MSNIEEISEQLSAYLDGELSSEESRRVDEMVAGDPALSGELESLREVRQILRSLPREQAPDGLIDAALAGAQRRRTGWWLGRLARAAVILLAVGIGVIVTARLNRPAQQNGTQTPPYSKTPTLVKSGLAGMGGTVTNVFINTDNLVLTQREVERVFGRNSVKPMVAAEEETVRVAKRDFAKHRGRGNFYNQIQASPNQVRYELAITENQMRQIVSELNEIRARQNVAQCPVRPRDGDDAIALAKADLRDKSTDGVKKVAEYARMRQAAAERTRRETVEKDSEHLADAGKRKETDSRPATTPKPADPLWNKAYAAKSSAGQTTRPTSIVMEQRQAGEIPGKKATHRQAATTLATANVRQLVVILNVVGAK